MCGVAVTLRNSSRNNRHLTFLINVSGYVNDQFLRQEVIFEMVQLPFYLVLYLKKDYSVFVLLEKTLKTINHLIIK